MFTRIPTTTTTPPTFMMTMTSFEPQAQTHPINITPMSAQEARECINAIKGNLESLRLMLLELHLRRGWESLGYSSWEECALEEFGKSRSYVFQLVAAAEVEENLASAGEKSTIVDLQNIPVSHLTALAKLPPDQQVKGLLKAEEIAQAEGKKRNATHITQAVKEIKPKKQALTQPPSAALAKPTDKPRTGWDISPQALTTTVKGHKIAVHFERRGKEFFFGFKGSEHTISASGFHHEQWNGPKIPKKYLNPGVYADFRAEELYADYQKSMGEYTQTDEQIPDAVEDTTMQ